MNSRAVAITVSNPVLSIHSNKVSLAITPDSSTVFAKLLTPYEDSTLTLLLLFSTILLTALQKLSPDSESSVIMYNNYSTPPKPANFALISLPFAVSTPL